MKALTGKIGDLNSAIEEQKETLATVVDEIKKLSEGIVELDRSVAAATLQLKEEHATFTETLAANNAAIQLIEMAKNRMNKFYNPKLYKAPPPKKMTEEERIAGNFGAAAIQVGSIE